MKNRFVDWKDKYDVWRLSPLGYDFRRVFGLVYIIYLLCTFYDFSLTYITFSQTPDNFFNNEISFVIKKALGGSFVFVIVILVLVLLPLVAGLGLNLYVVRKHGLQIKELKFVSFFVGCISVIHVWGGLTNFFYLINMG